MSARRRARIFSPSRLEAAMRALFALVAAVFMLTVLGPVAKALSAGRSAPRARVAMVHRTTSDKRDNRSITPVIREYDEEDDDDAEYDDRDDDVMPALVFESKQFARVLLFRTYTPEPRGPDGERSELHRPPIA
jgi:hypothetical protein